MKSEKQRLRRKAVGKKRRQEPWEKLERAEVKEMHETLKEKKAYPERLAKLGLVYAREVKG